MRHKLALTIKPLYSIVKVLVKGLAAPQMKYILGGPRLISLTLIT